MKIKKLLTNPWTCFLYRQWRLMKPRKRILKTAYYLKFAWQPAKQKSRYFEHWFLHQNDRAKKAFPPQQKVSLLPHSAWVRVSKPLLLHHRGRWLTWIITHYLNLGLATVSTSSSFVPPSFWRSICKEVLSPACRSDFVSNKKMRWCVRHRAVRHGGGLKNDPHISVLLFKLLALCTMFIQWAASKIPF